MELIVLVVAGRLIAAPLLGQDVHEHRTLEVARPAQRRLQRINVVSVDWSDVLQAEILEHYLWSNDVLDPLLHAV